MEGIRIELSLESIFIFFSIIMNESITIKKVIMGHLLKAIKKDLKGILCNHRVPKLMKHNRNVDVRKSCNT
jgi:hypothetical protein